MPQRKTIKWDYDSVRDYHYAYRDSVLVDVHYDAKTGFKNVYVHKDYKDSWKGVTQNNQGLEVNDYQYWIVPTFFSIMMALIIFAAILYRDNNKALKQKAKHSILSNLKKNV